jgi:hypothetical protein
MLIIGLFNKNIGNNTTGRRRISSFSQPLSSLFHAFQKFTGDIRAFEPHDALFRAAKTKQIDTPIPYDLLIDECKFLVYV